MKVELHPCFILHQRPYKETSTILDVFSLEYGRISLVAKGAKRAVNNLSTLLQPVRRLKISWSIRTDLGTLTGVELIGYPYKLHGKWLLSCFYINELLIRMLHKHESHPDLFQIYDRTISELNSCTSEDRILRIFEKHLLKSLGYGLVLDHEIESGDPINSETTYYYQSEYGPVINKPAKANCVKLSGRTLLALSSEQDWDTKISNESKRLLRMILDDHTGERPLESRILYKSYLNNLINI